MSEMSEMRICSDNKGMTLLEVIISFAIIAIVVTIFITGFVTVGNLDVRTHVQEKNDASLSLDIETTESLKEAGPPTTEHIISSNGYQMDITIDTYTSADGLDSIRLFNYEP